MHHSFIRPFLDFPLAAVQVSSLESQQRVSFGTTVAYVLVPFAYPDCQTDRVLGGRGDDL